MQNRHWTGILLASAAGVFWGAMGIAAQYLMQHCGFDVYDLVSLRLAGAGVMLLLFERFVAMHDIAAPFRRRQDLFDLVALRDRHARHSVDVFPFHPNFQRRHGRPDSHDGAALCHGLDGLRGKAGRNEKGIALAFCSPSSASR